MSPRFALVSCEAMTHAAAATLTAGVEAVVMGTVIAFRMNLLPPSALVETETSGTIQEHGRSLRVPRPERSAWTAADPAAPFSMMQSCFPEVGL